jgi:hypothetical protein
MQISEDLVSDFKETWMEMMNQTIHGVQINDTHLHLIKKLYAMMNQDYKELYHLERIEHERNKRRLQELPMHSGYGYFTGPEESVIYPAETDKTIRVCPTDCNPSCECSSSINVELRRSAFHRPTVNRINLEASIWE